MKLKFDKTLDHFSEELRKIRDSRANPEIIEDITVDVYGSKMPIKQLGNVSIVDPTLMVVSCWDKSIIEEVKKAIESSDTGLVPMIDGTNIKIPLPPMSQERREELVKLVKKIAEEARISIRNVRHELLDELETQNLSEDDKERNEKEIQKWVDEYNKKIDEELKSKENDLMTI